jgi:hypothetical protein
VRATKWWQYGLAPILLLYLVITVAYGLINPLFEAPDEHHHFFTVLYIKENGRLPIADLNDEWARQEAAQPPLYYLLGALLVAPLDTSQAQEQVWFNPFVNLGDPSALTNINHFVPTIEYAWPELGSLWAAYGLRLFSTLLGSGTLLFIYASGRLIWPQQPEIPLLATGMVAFLPQFNFIHSAISNDTLATFLCTAVLWQLVRLWQTHLSWSRLFWLGLTVGLTILSKTVGLLILLFSMGVLFLLTLHDRQLTDNQSRPVVVKELSRNLLLILIPALLIGGWLWWRNWQLYGDITAATIFIEFAGGHRQYTLLQVLAEWPGLWQSLLALFGWFNLQAPAWVYWLWSGMLLAALVGLLLLLRDWWVQHQANLLDGQPLLAALTQPWFLAVWLALWPLLVYTGLVAFMLRTEAAQGRLLFPALLPPALAVAYGLSRWRQPLFFVAPPLLGLTTTLFCLLWVIRPAYALPPHVAELPPQAVAIRMDMGQGVVLVGADVETKTAVPGDPIWLSLYWQKSTTVAETPELVVEILGRELEPIGRLHSYHGRGLYPANLWPTDQIVADRFALRLDEGAETPVWATLYAGLAGEQSRAAVGQVQVRPESWPAADGPALAYLGDGIILTAVSISATSVRPGESLDLTVQWKVNQPPPGNFTTLVHLGEAGQPPLATGDSPPLRGQYPTPLWPVGAVINDAYTLTLPPDTQAGRYPIWLGLYDSNTLARLPLIVNDQRQANDVYLAGWIEVVR